MPPLIVDSRLVAAAAEYAEFFVETQWRLPQNQPAGEYRTYAGQEVFVPGVHIGGDCRTFIDRALAQGYPLVAMGENAHGASGSWAAPELFDTWILQGIGTGRAENPAHPAFSTIGIACYRLPPADLACVQILAASAP